MAEPRMSKEDIREAGRLRRNGVHNDIGRISLEIGSSENYSECIRLIARASVLIEAGSHDKVFADTVAEGRTEEEGKMSEILYLESHDNHVQS